MLPKAKITRETLIFPEGLRPEGNMRVSGVILQGSYRPWKSPGIKMLRFPGPESPN